MTESIVAYTKLHNADAGEDLARQIQKEINGSPDAVIVFASPDNDHSALLKALQAGCQPGAIVGCSSAGEFTSDVSGEGMSCVMALRSPDMRFNATVGRGLAEDRDEVVRSLVAGFGGNRDGALPHRAALVLVDALAGYAEELIEKLTKATGGDYRFFGGGAGDDARFAHTSVFCGTEVFSNAAVALEILTSKPLGIGARHGWTPAGEPLRVTETQLSSVLSLNVAPAREAFSNHAESTTQKFDVADPMPFFLHNIVGVKTPTGHKLRVPLGIREDGGVIFAAEVPRGATTHIMCTADGSAVEAAAEATRDAVSQVVANGDKPAVALFFDCVATRLRMGDAFCTELETVGDELGGVRFAGFNSYGQIVRSDGQFSGFHNCTAVVCVFPE